MSNTGNVPAGADEESLQSFLVLVATQVGLLASGGSPLVSLRLSGHYAFIEVRSAIEASSLLRISGVPFCGTRLRISRPTKYQDASLSRRDDDSLGLTWTDTLEEYRASVPQFRSLDSDNKSSPPLRPLSLDVVTRLAILTDAPTNALVLRNVLQTARTTPCLHVPTSWSKTYRLERPRSAPIFRLSRCRFRQCQCCR